MMLLVFLAIRHLHCKNGSSCACAKMKCSGGNGSTAVHAGCIIHKSTLSCEAVVLKHGDEMNSTDTLFSAALSDCSNASGPVISRHSSLASCAPYNRTSLSDITPDTVTLERISASVVGKNDKLPVSESSPLHMFMPPCDRLSDVHPLKENTANSASNSVSMTPMETKTKSLLDNCCVIDISNQLVSCVKESSVPKELHSHPTDGISSLSSMRSVKNRDYSFPRGQLPEINRIHLEAEKSMLDVNFSNSLVEKDYTPVCVDSSVTSVRCLPDCVLPNVTVASDPSQNGLSAVEHIVSCFKSITAVTKLQKTVCHKG